MATFSLHHLIQSIAGAVAEAQDKIHRYQISAISQYFDADNRPVGVDVRLPSLAHDAEEGEERIVRVPLLSLVGMKPLAVKDMEITFEVGLGAPEAAPKDVPPKDEKDAPKSASGKDGEDKPAEVAAGDTKDDDSDAWPDDKHTPIGIDMGASKNRDSGPMARITLRVESQAPSEGMARLIHLLDKSI